MIRARAKRPGFWSVVAARGVALPPEVLVHVLRAFRARGRGADVERATDLLLAHAYPIAAGIVARCLRSRPRDREDAVLDAFETMWRRIAAGDLFWERNFRGALNAACLSACRRYYAEKRSDTPLAEIRHPPGGAEYDPRFRDVSADQQQRAVLHDLTYPLALAALDSPIREAWRLHTEEELTQAEIAERLGCAKKTVYSRLIRAREQLAAYFQEEDDDGC
jgi:RNA polymerase sigma factor (sigma-70 family)